MSLLKARVMFLFDVVRSFLLLTVVINRGEKNLPFTVGNSRGIIGAFYIEPTEYEVKY